MKVRTGITAPGFDRAFTPPDSRSVHLNDVLASGEIDAPSRGRSELGRPCDAGRHPKFAIADERTGYRQRTAPERERRSPRLTNAEENRHGRIGADRAARAVRRASRSSLPWSVWALLIAGWLVLSAVLAVAAWSVAS